MKKTLRNIALAGTLLLGSLGFNSVYSQVYPDIKASKKQIKKELGTDNIFDINYLGNGYVSLKGPGKYNPKMNTTERSKRNENLEGIKMAQGINSGSLKLEKTENGVLISGTYFGNPSKETLEELDCIKRDYIITPEEIKLTLRKKVNEIL